MNPYAEQSSHTGHVVLTPKAFATLLNQAKLDQLRH